MPSSGDGLAEREHDDPGGEREDEPTRGLEEREPVALPHEQYPLARGEQRCIPCVLVLRRARAGSPGLDGVGHECSRDRGSSRAAPAPILLSSHRDAQPLLRRDQVVEILGGLVEVDLHPVDAAR